MPTTVMTPTLMKSCASVSSTSVNWAVGPPMWPDAAGPNDAAPATMTVRASLTLAKASPL